MTHSLLTHQQNLYAMVMVDQELLGPNARIVRTNPHHLILFKLKALEFNKISCPYKNGHITTRPLLSLTSANANGVAYCSFRCSSHKIVGHNLYKILVRNN